MKEILINWKSLSTVCHTRDQTFLVCKIPLEITMSPLTIYFDKPLLALHNW